MAIGLRDHSIKWQNTSIAGARTSNNLVVHAGDTILVTFLVDVGSGTATLSSFGDSQSNHYVQCIPLMAIADAATASQAYHATSISYFATASADGTITMSATPASSAQSAILLSSYDTTLYQVDYAQRQTYHSTTANSQAAIVSTGDLVYSMGTTWGLTTTWGTTTGASILDAATDTDANWEDTVNGWQLAGSDGTLSTTWTVNVLSTNVLTSQIASFTATPPPPIATAAHGAILLPPDGVTIGVGSDYPSTVTVNTLGVHPTGCKLQWRIDGAGGWTDVTTLNVQGAFEYTLAAVDYADGQHTLNQQIVPTSTASGSTMTLPVINFRVADGLTITTGTVTGGGNAITTAMTAYAASSNHLTLTLSLDVDAEN